MSSKRPQIMKPKNKKITKAKTTSPTALGSLIRSLGSLGGTALGGLVGQPGIGGAAGSSLGASLSKWLGQGDYSVRSNSLVSSLRSNGQIPSMHRNSQSVTVRHKEYITDIFSGTAFTLTNTYALNPGLSTTFPWLSTIAQNYQEYTFKGVVFEFVSTSGDVVASSNTALGSVMFATQYRATAANFTSKVQMLNEYFSSDGKPSESFCHPVECNPRENPYNVQYVRGGPVPAGEDAKTYDLGILNIACEGMQAANVDIGELWVSYEVELRKPVASGAINAYAGFARYYGTSGINTTNPFSSAVKLGVDTLGVAVTSTKLTFPAGGIGNYMVVLAYGGAASAIDTSTWLSSGTLVNCTNATITTNALSVNGVYDSFSAGTNNGYFCNMAVFTVPDATLQASFTPTVNTLTGATSVTLYIAHLGPQSA